MPVLRIPTRAMRGRITLILPSDEADGSGGVTRSWTAGPLRWAQIVAEAGESTTGRPKATHNARLRLVLRRGTAALQLPLRVSWRGDVYAVVQAHDVPEQGIQQLIVEKL